MAAKRPPPPKQRRLAVLEQARIKLELQLAEITATLRSVRAEIAALKASK